MDKQEYMEYVDQVLAILDKTQVPAIFNMAHTLADASHEIHARVLNITIMDCFLMSMSPKETADIIEYSVTAAFVKMFATDKTVN